MSLSKRELQQKKLTSIKQTRLKLLFELESLKEKLCDRCMRTKGGARSSHYTCDCSAAKRMRVIGQELLALTNESTKVRKKEVKKVTKKRNQPVLTEEAVNAMKAKGMTYSAIAKHFGISAPTLANRRQNWELEKVRAQHQKEQTAPKAEVTSVPKETSVKSSSTSLGDSYNEEIKRLKESIIQKNEIITVQKKEIEQLTNNINDIKSRIDLFDEYKFQLDSDRQLLSILLERETMRLKNLV